MVLKEADLKNKSIKKKPKKANGFFKNPTKPKKPDNEDEDEEDNEEDIKKKNIKKKPEELKIHFAEFVTMTNAEHEKLVSTYGKEFTDQCITVLDNYKGANGKKYKSDYRAILNWVVEKVSKTIKQNKKSIVEEWLNNDQK